MYSLPYFKEEDPDVVVAFMKQHPFVTVCGSDAAGKPVATQIPVLIRENEGRLVLHGHIMKNTDHHKAFLQNPEVLAIFTGPHTYVSASWYTNPQQGSTWNYMTVHAKGQLQFMDEAALLNLLQELTAHFENNDQSPSLFEKLPDEYINRLSKAIIAIEITVQETENVFKLSQNRDETSYRNIMEKLRTQDEDAQQIAQEMEKRASRLFRQDKTPA
jgi:transcriptional regulator